ncbi:MAG: ATP-binding protein [Tepidisphaeraceae bacterium]|jgi:anti-sigma regulatory factor (Ser/Thr protein kinase)
MNRLELKITSDPANLRDVRKQVEAFAHIGGMPLEDCDAVGLVINEALANIIRHGYHGAHDQPIMITAETDDGQLRLQIRDWAKPFDPSTLPKKETADLKPGGLGLLCMRRLMDEAEFVPLPDGMLLKLLKRSGKSANNGT